MKTYHLHINGIVQGVGFRPCLGVRAQGAAVFVEQVADAQNRNAVNHRDTSMRLREARRVEPGSCRDMIGSYRWMGE